MSLLNRFMPIFVFDLIDLATNDLVSKETAVLCYQGTETKKYAIKQVDNGETSTVKR